jgi:flagellar basal body-associated protein FliL
MAEETQTPEESAKAGKGEGGGGMLPALLIIALMPVISFAMFKFVFLPELKKIAPEEGAAADHVEIDPENIHVKSGETYRFDFPKVVVNVRGVSLSRFFSASFTVESSNPDIEHEVTEHMAEMKDLAGTILGRMTLADHENVGIKNQVRNQLKQGFNKTLQPLMIDEIFFSEWAVQ